jgi:hypothetical protein
MFRIRILLGRRIWILADQSPPNGEKQCCGSGSSAFLTPGSGIGFFRIPDLGSQTHIFKSLVTIFRVKSSINSMKIGPNFFLQHVKIIQFCEICGYKKKGWKTEFFSPLSLFF